MKLFYCSHCGYVYEPLEGDWIQRVPANTAFGDLLDSWVCPECNAPKRAFKRQSRNRIAPGGQSEWIGEERV